MTAVPWVLATHGEKYRPGNLPPTIMVKARANPETLYVFPRPGRSPQLVPKLNVRRYRRRTGELSVPVALFSLRAVAFPTERRPPSCCFWFWTVSSPLLVAPFRSTSFAAVVCFLPGTFPLLPSQPLRRT